MSDSPTANDSPKAQFVIRLPEDQAAEVDRRAKDLGISRNEWYANATRWLLANTKTIVAKNEAMEAKVPADRKHQWVKEGSRNRCSRCGILDGMFSHVACTG